MVISFYAAVVVLALGAVFGGALPRRMMPYVESPLVGIVTMQPGLSAQEMETYISKPIEERMTDIRGVRYIRSTSQDGLSIVSLEFPYGTDIKKATTDVQSVMNAAQADLPQTGANLKPSWVLPIDPLNIPVLSLSVTGDADRGWTPLALRQFAENEGVAALKQVPDVQSVEVYGGQKRQLRVVVDRDKLAAYGYSILDVRDAIDRNSVARPAGVITSGPNEAIVRVADLAQDAQAVANYPLGSENGQVVSIKDVASVTDGAREQRSGYQFVDGERHRIEGLGNSAVELAVIQNPAAGSPPVIAAVQKQIAQIGAGPSGSALPCRLRQRPLREHPVPQHGRGAGPGRPALRPGRAAVSGQRARDADLPHHHPCLHGDGDPADGPLRLFPELVHADRAAHLHRTPGGRLGD